MEYLAGIGFLAWAVLMVVLVCITIAPLIIWRNTNRTNRLLEDILDEARLASKLLAALARPRAAAPDKPQPQDKPQSQDFELS